MEVRDLRSSDWPEVARIYREGIETGDATFETEVPSWERSQGVGSELLATVVESSERGGIWTLQTSVFPEKEASLRLLRRFGFREVGFRKRIGRLHGIWRDTVLVERRSEVVT